jgi:predicted TIM-barrel fold metal-dependent hydrolase
MERSGVDLSINLPVLTTPEQTDKVNDSLLAGRDKMLDMGILTFGGMHPGYSAYREKLRMLAREGVKGIKLHPAYQRTDLDDPVMMRIIDAANESGLIVLIHAGLDIGIPGHDYSDISMILRVLEEVRPSKLVLAHMGGWKNWKAVGKYIAGAPVWLDTAFVMGRIDRKEEGISSISQWVPGSEVTACKNPEDDDFYNMTADSFLTLCQKHGTDRILFATDCPWADQKAYVDAFRSLPFTEEEQNAILGENALKLLGMTDTPAGN